MHQTLRASFIALAMIFVATLSTQAQAACLKGYYRFADSQTATAWKARPADYTGGGPHGISVFEDLSSDQYKVMAAARNLELGKRKTLVYRVSCDAAITGNLDVTAAPTALTNWTKQGGYAHSLIGYAGATVANDFNTGMVGGKTAPAFLFDNAVLVIRIPPAQ